MRAIAMKTVSMLEFRLHADKIIAQVQKGQRMILTCRGKPVARLEPIVQESIDADDPFYSLPGVGDASGESLTNEQIDDILYGQ
jgi:antitoxin (DNA-binding transcriptional repressor) of toxin-antitoxin stability system